MDIISFPKWWPQQRGPTQMQISSQGMLHTPFPPPPGSSPGAQAARREGPTSRGRDRQPQGRHQRP